MGARFDSIQPQHEAFIRQQKVFFVATAPVSGHINVSPKGMDSFRIFGPRQVAWLNLTGSGNETAAHVQENGRMSIMFCAFEGEPLILRLYGRSTMTLPADDDWPGLLQLFPSLPGARQIFVMDVELVQTSCGFGVPLYAYLGDRDNLIRWTEKKGADGIRDYWRKRNSFSLDGKPIRID